MTITIPDLAALAEMFPNYAVAWWMFLGLSFVGAFAYMMYCNINTNKPKRGFAVMLLWAALFLLTVASYEERSDCPQAIEDSQD